MAITVFQMYIIRRESYACISNRITRYGKIYLFINAECNAAIKNKTSNYANLGILNDGASSKRSRGACRNMELDALGVRFRVYVVYEQSGY